MPHSLVLLPQLLTQKAKPELQIVIFFHSVTCEIIYFFKKKTQKQHPTRAYLCKLAHNKCLINDQNHRPSVKGATERS